jgi:hypothetical protein
MFICTWRCYSARICQKFIWRRRSLANRSEPTRLDPTRPDPIHSDRTRPYKTWYNLIHTSVRQTAQNRVRSLIIHSFEFTVLTSINSIRIVLSCLVFYDHMIMSDNSRLSLVRVRSGPVCYTGHPLEAAIGYPGAIHRRCYDRKLIV